MIKSYSQRARIMLVDHDKRFLEVASIIIENSGFFMVTAISDTLSSVLKKVKSEDPTIILVGGLENTDQSWETLELLRRESKAAIILYTTFDMESTVFKALELGISGYLLKNQTSYLELVEGLKRVTSGGVAFSEPIARMIVQSFCKNSDSPLSRRETQVLNLVSKGNTASEIAQELFISKGTAKTHIRNIYKTLNVTSKSEALHVATSLRLI